METLIEYNNYSDKLKAVIKKALPAPGRTIYFESERPKGRGSTVPNTDRIKDPFTGEYVDIAYITGFTPARGKEPARHEFGRIQFRRTDFGRIGVTGGNRAAEQLFAYLFLTNNNKTNSQPREWSELHESFKDGEPAPWFMHPGKGYTFHQDEPKERAQKKLEKDRRVRQAKDAVDKMGDDQLREVALGLDIPHNDWTDLDEIRVALIQIADQPEGASKILNLDKDERLRVTILTKKAQKFGIIEFDAALSIWKWPDSSDPICVVPPGSQNTFDPIVSYFLGKGIKAYEVIKGLVDAQVEKKKAQKAGKDK